MMVYQKYSAYLKRRKYAQCKYSTTHELKIDVFFHLLLLLALKVEKAHLQSENKPEENISKYFTISDNSSHTIRVIPSNEEYTTKITPFVNANSNINIRKLPATLQKSVSNADNLKFAKIEPSNHDNMIHTKALDMSKSGDSFTKSQIKNAKRISDPGSGSKTKNTKFDDFFKTNCSKLKSDGNKRNIPVGKKSNTPSSTDSVNEEISSKDGYFERRNSILTISNSSKILSKDVERQCVTGKNDKETTLDPDEEHRGAEKMTKCIAKDFNKGGIVCVCNKTYCDKILPISRLPPGKFSWYKSTYDGYRFHKSDGQLSKITDYSVKGTIFIYTRRQKLQTFIGCGGAFSDSASKNIESLSKETRNHLMRSYYGSFGIEYVLGRVPIGGTDFSPKFYTYMDIPKKFMLSEQDLKYKIPAIQEAIKITRNKLKLLGCSWTAPKWMKTKCNSHDGELKREYFQLYADYYVMFLDNYAKNGIKFWALSPGNKPMLPYNRTDLSHINAMEWSPYKQSKWVNRFLVPTLNQSGYQHVQLIIGDENRELISYYVKWFFEPLWGENYKDMRVFLANDAYYNISGISVHGYADAPENEAHLITLHDLYINKSVILAETACYGKPQLGVWDCAERYAKQLMNYFRNYASAFIDWNLALDQEGGPSYLNNFLDAAIIVNIEKDEFYKQPIYYVIGHFSKFITPDSYMIPLDPYNSTITGIAAIAAKRPDHGVVVVAYNRSPNAQNTTFIINKEYSFSLNISPKSINTVIFWLPNEK